MLQGSHLNTNVMSANGEREFLTNSLRKKKNEMAGASILSWHLLKYLLDVETENKSKTPRVFSLRCLGILWHVSTFSSCVHLHHERANTHIDSMMYQNKGSQCGYLDSELHPKMGP